MRLGLSSPYDRVLGYIIHCALFHHETDAVLEHGRVPPGVPQLGSQIHLRYMKHCMPQKAYWYPDGMVRMTRIPVHFDWHTKNISQASRERLDMLQYFFHTGEVVLDTEYVIEAIQQFPPSARRAVFVSVCLHLGWPSLLMLVPRGFEAVKEKLQGIRLAVLRRNYSAEILSQVIWSGDFWQSFPRDLETASAIGPNDRAEADPLFSLIQCFSIR